MAQTNMPSNDSDAQQTPVGQPFSKRLQSIDALRGLVILLMALDHSRDFFGDLRVPPNSIEVTPISLFVTRWITHFCAPTFVFLAGTSAWLFGKRRSRKSKLVDGNYWSDRQRLSLFLLTRGLWLLILEFTLIYFGLALSFSVVPWMFLVIAAIGASMIVLSLLVLLPTPVVGMIGILIIGCHNLLDPVDSEQLGAWGPIWMLLHDGPGYLPALRLEVGYPVLPWLGVMAAGYGFGPILVLPPGKRRALLALLGFLLLFGFIFLRLTNQYGDPNPWKWQTVPALNSTADWDGSIPPHIAVIDYPKSAMSFVNCQKYPPSLCFVLMTLGPALGVLCFLDWLKPNHLTIRLLEAYGRVPLFFYIVHFYLLHLSSVVTYWLVRGEPLSPFQAIYGQMAGQPLPASYGFQSLWLVYLVWFGLIAVMHPLCRWYGGRKRKGSSWIWSYL